MKKIAFVMIIAAISMFMSPVIASADGNHWWLGKRLNGDYAMTASGGCFHSSTGFSQTSPDSGLYIPNSAAVTWGATIAATAFWTFESDGTGTVWSGENYVIDFPPGNTMPVLFPTAAPASVNRMNPFSFAFTYTVTPYGDITVTPTPNPFGLPILEGTISQDKRTITLVSMNKLGGSPKGPAVCSVTRVLIKTANLPDPPRRKISK